MKNPDTDKNELIYEFFLLLFASLVVFLIRYYVNHKKTVFKLKVFSKAKQFYYELFACMLLFLS